MKVGDTVIINLIKLEKNLEKEHSKYKLSDYLNHFPLAVGKIETLKDDIVCGADLIFLVPNTHNEFGLLIEELKVLEDKMKGH